MEEADLARRATELASPTKVKAWFPATPTLASIADRSILSPWAWLKSVIVSRPVAVDQLSQVLPYWKVSAPGPAGQDVLAAGAEQHVVLAVAGERVGELGGGDVLDAAQRVARRRPATARPGRQIHLHPGRALVERRGVDPGTTVDDVGAGIAAEEVVPVAAGQLVGAGPGPRSGHSRHLPTTLSSPSAPHSVLALASPVMLSFCFEP